MYSKIHFSFPYYARYSISKLNIAKHNIVYEYSTLCLCHLHMILFSQSNSSSVASQISVLEVNDRLSNEVVRGGEIFVPHLYFEVLVHGQLASHLEHAGTGLRVCVICTNNKNIRRYEIYIYIVAYEK